MKNYRTLFPVISLCLGICLAFLAAEIFLRCYVKWGNITQQNTFNNFIIRATSIKKNDLSNLYRRSKDPIINFEFIPNSRRDKIRINADGFRGREFPENVSEGMVRIAVVGDSEAFGDLLQENETVSGMLEEELNKRAEKKIFEVLNFGVPGYNSIQELRLIQKKVIKYNPSIVILYYVFNDAILDESVLLLHEAPFYKSYLSVFMYWFFNYRKYLFDVSPRGRAQMHFVEFYQKLFNSKYFNLSLNSIEQINQFLKKRHVKFILLITPEIIGFDSFDNYPYNNIHSSLQALAMQNIDVVDSLDEIIALKLPPKMLWVTSTDCHKNKKANSAIVCAILKYLIVSNNQIKY